MNVFLGTFPLKANYTNYLPALAAVLWDATTYVGEMRREKSTNCKLTH